MPIEFGTPVDWTDLQDVIAAQIVIAGVCKAEYVYPMLADPYGGKSQKWPGADQFVTLVGLSFDAQDQIVAGGNNFPAAPPTPAIPMTGILQVTLWCRLGLDQPN